jgi:hypothetical protein
MIVTIEPTITTVRAFTSVTTSLSRYDMTGGRARTMHGLIS